MCCRDVVLPCHFLENGGKNVLFSAEMIIKRRALYSDGGGIFPHGDAVIALLRKEPERLINDFFLGGHFFFHGRFPLSQP